MGEAKNRKLGRDYNDGKSRWLALDRRSSESELDTALPGFYDHPNFLTQERNDPLFAESYAEWVLLRERDHVYDSRTREVVPKLAEIIEARIIRHGWQGACICDHSDHDADP